MITVSTVETALRRFRDLGCSQVFLKVLSSKQDNEKNQIYLGSRLEIFSILPGKVTVGLASESVEKRKSSKGESKLELELLFYWITENGIGQAPNAKLINYFQYPEIRFSGFLSQCEVAPDALRRAMQDQFGQRVLLLGTSEDTVYGLVLSEKINGDLSSLSSAPYWLDQKLIRVLETKQNEAQEVNPSKLVEELSKLAGIEYSSRSLKIKGGLPIPWRGTQGAGYTLEALLGVVRNGKAAPDKYGFEIKSFLSSPITLMTTQPDGGVRSKFGLINFLKLFGWAGAKDDGSLRFNGKHSPEKSTPRSGLKMVVNNWDSANQVPEGSNEPAVQLIDKQTKAVAAEWSFMKLGSSWARKHAGAIYVEASSLKKDGGGHPSHYLFGPSIYVCMGTTPLKLISAIATGLVYLDPGDRLYKDGSSKSRTQWRMAFSKKLPLEHQLKQLYHSVERLTI